MLHEYRKGINKMKPKKSPRTDFAGTVEALKFGGSKLQYTVLDICNSVLNDLGVPLQWTEYIIVTTPAKGWKAIEDFHGIFLMSIAARVYNRILLSLSMNQLTHFFDYIKVTSERTEIA